MPERYDAVIVGAGLAGLSAAYGLRDTRVLILEREDYAGGRIHTRTRSGVSYDLGAVLAYDPAYLPFPFAPPPPIREDGPIGLFFGETVHRGDSVMECIGPALSESPAALEAVERFRTGGAGPETLPPMSRDIVNAFFQVIHPGEIEEYVPARRADAFIRYRPVHYAGGNRSVVDAFLAETGAEVTTGATVRSVGKKDGAYRVRFATEGDEREVRADAVVIATAAPAVSPLCPDLENAFPAPVRYGRFTIVAVGTERDLAGECAYVVSPELDLTTMYRTSFPDSALKVFLFFYCDRASRKMGGLSDEDAIRRTVDAAGRVGLALSVEDIAFTDIHRWEEGGTIISPDCASTGTADHLNPSPGLFVAGDYLFGPFPYGMEAAVRSGTGAGLTAREFLGGTRR